MKTVWMYEKADTLMEFASEAEARAWLKANEPDGIAVGSAYSAPVHEWASSSAGARC
jgi:hypothetical protein